MLDENLMSDTQMNVAEHFETLTEDPAEAFASKMGLDLLDFCLEQLDREISGNCLPEFQYDMDEDAFQVC
jgi:hypothetical protein